MSSYKVIQDIEAEDKLIGPLTLRQSIYGGIAMVCLYICFLAYTKHATFLIGIFLPIAAIGVFFAFPWKGEQPTEIWALARLRFMIKPRVRIWDQSGVKDVVTVLAPRKLETRRPLTNNLSENEVRSRLKALADTIDSRGWATRNASYALYASQYQSKVAAPGQTLPSAGPVADDMFDASSSVSQNFDAMLARSSQNQRQRVMQSMAQAQNPPQQPQYAQQMPPQPQNYGQQAYAQPQYQQQPVQNAMPIAPQQAPQLPAPVMPVANLTNQMNPMQQQAPPVPQSPQQADYWFANGPGYPGSAPGPSAMPPTSMPPAPQQLPPSQPPVQTPAPEPTPPQQPIDVAPVASAIPEPYVEAIESGKISADVPIVTAATPNDDEMAFAEIARHQKLAEQRNYNHVRVVAPSSQVAQQTAAPAPQQMQAPSVPGMIDYGRPQPADDQMQYDTSMPQSAPQPVADPVTRKPDPAILELAKNDDLDVATIARQAHRETRKSSDEVEIQLH